MILYLRNNRIKMEKHEGITKNMEIFIHNMLYKYSITNHLKIK